MSSQADILGRIREALTARAPAPGHHGETAPAPAAGSFRQWLPPVGESFEDRQRLFAQNAAMLKAVFKTVPNPEAAAAEIRQLVTAHQWKKMATHTSPLTDAVCGNLGVDWLRTDQPYETAELEKCSASVTACEALVAQTGSVLVTSRSCGGRAISILPPHHIVVAAKDQLLPDLAAAFELMRRKYKDDYPSTISFITGPSRTGDIERILVLGAHGPKELTILLIA